MFAIVDRLRPSWKSFTPTSRLSRSLKVIVTDTDRSATYDFLLVFHSNYEPISYRFRDKSDNCKILPHPSVLNALAEHNTAR